MFKLVLSFFFFFSSRRRHTRWTGDWSSDVCSSDLPGAPGATNPSERGVLEPVGEQGVLAEDLDPRGGGRQAAGQDEQQADGGTADRDVGFAVAAGDGDAGRCPGDEPLSGAGQSGVGGVNMQALAVSAQVLCWRAGRIGGSRGAGGDAGEPFVDG